MFVNVSAVVSVQEMGVETIVRAIEDRQMATPLTNILRCEAEGDDSMAHYHRLRDVGGINSMEAFHVVCKEVRQL
jgi:hypothetical protein